MNGKLFKTVSEAEVEGTLNDLVNQKIEKIRKKDPVYATAMLENLNKI